MKRYFVHLIIYIGALIAISACNDDDVQEPTPDPYTDPEHLENVAILYYFADNNLSNKDGQNYAQKDIQEIVQGKDNIPYGSKVVVYVDEKFSTPTIYQIDAHYGLRTWKTYEKEEDCTDSLTMLTNLRQIINGFPAKSYTLSFGGHGTGWNRKQRKAMGYDESHNSNYINIPTLRGVLEQLPKMKFIFFDECFMQCIEVAYELRDVADWIVGSPAEIPFPGAPYHLITSAMTSGNALELTKTYASHYPAIYEGARYPGALLSAIDCSKLEELAKATRKHIVPLYEGRNMCPTTGIQKYSTSMGFTYCYDMNSAMHKLLTEEDYKEWLTMFQQAVPASCSSSTNQWYAYYYRPAPGYFATLEDAEHYGGVSIFLPEEWSESRGYTSELHDMQWYEAAGWDLTGW